LLLIYSVHVLYPWFTGYLYVLHPIYRIFIVTPDLQVHLLISELISSITALNLFTPVFKPCFHSPYSYIWFTGFMFCIFDKQNICLISSIAHLLPDELWQLDRWQALWWLTTIPSEAAWCLNTWYFNSSTTEVLTWKYIHIVLIYIVHVLTPELQNVSIYTCS
jgi:hypothetical protein